MYLTTFNFSDLIVTDCLFTDAVTTDAVTENVGASFTTELVLVVFMALILLTGISVIIGLKYKKKSPKITTSKPDKKPIPEPDVIPDRGIERIVEHSEPTTTVGEMDRDKTTPVEMAQAEDKTKDARRKRKKNKDARRKRKKRRPIGTVKDTLPIEAGTQTYHSSRNTVGYE